MANLVSRLSYDGRLRHVRDKEYFSWRFQNPLRKYRFIFWKETCLEGYMVLQSYGCESSGGGRVNIVDWEGTSLQIQTELLQVALHWGNFRELFSWTTTLSGEKKAILANAGFKPIQPQQGSKYRNCVIVRSVRDDMLDRESIIANHKILDLANWDLRMIYSMHG